MDGRLRSNAYFRSYYYDYNLIIFISQIFTIESMSHFIIFINQSLESNLKVFLTLNSRLLPAIDCIFESFYMLLVRHLKMDYIHDYFILNARLLLFINRIIQ